MKMPSLNSSTGVMAATRSPSSSPMKFTMARPFAFRAACGISYTFFTNTLPVLLKKKTNECVEQTKSWLTKSSSRASIPLEPFPPRFCAR